MRKTYTVTSFGKTYEVNAYRTTYADDRGKTALLLTDIDGSPFATLSVNLPNEFMNDGIPSFVYIDTNNCPWAEQFLTKNKLGRHFSPFYGFSGYCKYPLYEIDLDKFDELK